MIVYPLGHTEFGIEIASKNGTTVRILVDGWLSDYALGDLMERPERVTLDPELVAGLDGLFVSHSHCDHFDPYTLKRIYEYGNPTLLLPETLEYLVPTIRKYLGDIPLTILKHRQKIDFKWVEIMGMVLESESITNEDDVMTLAISNDEELIYAEIDTVIPTTEEAHEMLLKCFNRKKYQRVTYLRSRNELGANLPALDAASPADLDTLKKNYRRDRREELRYWFELLEAEGLPDYTDLDGFSVGYIGQGIAYPSYLSTKLHGACAMSLADINEMEISVAKEYDRTIPSTVLMPGKGYETSAKWLRSIGSAEFIGKIERKPLHASGKTSGRTYAKAPLFDEARDIEAQEGRILGLLNGSFLAASFANPDDNLKTAMLKNPDHAYRVAVRYGTGKSYEERTYAFDFSKTGFERDEGKKRIDEDYWANDLEDFLDGKQELYSNFFHVLVPGRTYRVWTHLGMNSIHHPLVIRKFDRHFELAFQNKTVNQYVEAIYEGLLA